MVGYNPARKFLIAALVVAGSLSGGCASVGDKPVSADDNTNSGEVVGRNGILTTVTRPSRVSENSGAIEPTVVEYDDYRDPLIGINRAVFAFNDVTYRYALIPLGKGYVKITPRSFRNSVSNFFYNIKMPIYLVNNVLQFKFEPAARSLVRFGINSTLGLFGLFDPARDWFNLERAETHFGDTLGHYGAGYGIYLVLPVLGPSDLRSGASVLVDHKLNPVPELVDDSSEATAIQVYDYFNDFAPSAEQYEILREKSEDSYIFFRNLHLQAIQRDVEYPPQ